MAQHVRQGLSEAHSMLLYQATDLEDAIEDFLLAKCGVTAVQIVGACRRRVEVIEDIAFVIETDDFPSVITRMQRYGGRTALLESSADGAVFALAAGITLRLRLCSAREGHDEVEGAVRGYLPKLVSTADIRGELHAHSTSSDGVHSIEQMAAAAQARGYEYIGISDHSQSLKIARGKSSEVDILADGSLDYPDDLLRELDYAVCSIHSRFGLNREQQTERLLRAMDIRYFNILGHATGRLLLKRPGCDIDIDRVIEHAHQNECFFEINSSPDRLDLSAENARRAALAGVLIAVNTDAHSMGELQLLARASGPFQKMTGIARRRSSGTVCLSLTPLLVSAISLVLSGRSFLTCCAGRR